MWPSCAIFKGASIKSVSETAKWTFELTFCKFYLRDIDVEDLQRVNYLSDELRLESIYSWSILLSYWREDFNLAMFMNTVIT